VDRCLDVFNFKAHMRWCIVAKPRLLLKQHIKPTPVLVKERFLLIDSFLVE